MPKKKAKPSKTRNVDAPFENDPTAERLRHAEGIADNFKTDSNRKTKRLGSILDHMLSRGLINQSTYTAGQLAYKQWYDGGLSPVGAVDLSRVRVDGGGNRDTMQHRIDNATKFGLAMRAIGLNCCRVYREMVLHETPPATYGLTHYGYIDRAVATAVAYSMLKDALHALELHYTGGKRPDNVKMRSHMASDGKPANKPDERKL